MKRCSLYLIGAAAAVLVLNGPAASARETTSPDILFIIADDMGPHLGCYGDIIAHTPVMDSIAADGVRFDNAWVTQASCSPSRSTIMTGLYPHQNGQTGLAHLGFSMHHDYPSIPSLMKKAGYYTGVIGKIHVKPMSSLPFDYAIEPGKFDVRDKKQCTEKMEEFLGQAGDKPIFLNMSYTDPHRPFMTQHAGSPAKPMKESEGKLLPFMKGLERVEGLLQDVVGYYNGIRRVDDCVGAALDTLKKHGRLENTVIVVIGDHGAPFARGKVTCYNPGMRIPFIVKWPDVAKAGSSSKALVSTLDLLPTFLEVAGAEVPSNLPGKPLKKAVANPEARVREYMFGEFGAHLPADYYPRRTVRSERYQLIENLESPKPNPTPGVEGYIEREAVKVEGLVDNPALEAVKEYVAPPKFELYDLQEDPENYHNLADKPELKDIQDELKAELDKWRKETDDPLLKPGAVEAEWQHIKNTTNVKNSGVKQQLLPPKYRKKNQ